MDLPLISTFTKMAIKAATAEFVAPKSLTLNLQDLLSGAPADAGAFFSPPTLPYLIFLCDR